MTASKRFLHLILACTLVVGLLGGCSGPSNAGSQGSGTTTRDSSAEGNASTTSAAPENCILPPYPDDYPDPSTNPLLDESTEEYARIDEPGFIATVARPLSTFSASVDTAAYCSLRRMVADGMKARDIDKNAVRIEEMLNYFPYDYAEPTDGDLFGVTSQGADCPWNPDTRLLVMGFATEQIDYDNAIKGSNLVFLIDTSGSMASSDKLLLLQDSFAELVEGLTERDRVSIVTYSGTERVVLEDARGTDKRAIMRAVDSLHAEGATNGEAGLETAYRLAEESLIEGGTNRIIMATDGDLNVGISSEYELHDYVSEKRDSNIYLSVLGFGSDNYKDNKMAALANNGNGTYHYIDCIDEAVKVFDEDLCANLVPLADDVKMQVEFNPELVKGYRLIGYENRALADEDFKDDTVDAGEVGQGHQFTLAYEVIMADSAMEIPEPDIKYGKSELQRSEDANATASADEWLTCSIRYKPAGSSDVSTDSYPITDAYYTAQPSSNWAFAASIIECGMVIRDSDHKGTASLREAQRLLGDSKLTQAQTDFENLLTQIRCTTRSYPSGPSRSYEVE